MGVACSMKWWYEVTRLHGVTTQKTATSIITTMITLKVLYRVYFVYFT
jgi:hypothetical protein